MNKETQPEQQPNFKVLPALCLDLDGTVRRNKDGDPFSKDLEQMELMPGIEDLIYAFREKGYMIVGITNQAGVAHGHKTPDDVMNEIHHMFSLFKQNPFNIIKACFHDGKGTVAPYNYRSLHRKPDIGMLAMAEFDAFEAGYIIDWDNSLFVGDRKEDQACANNANVEFMYIDSFLRHGMTVLKD